MLKRGNQKPILGLRLIGDYILCFGSRWLDLRHLPPLPNAGEQLISECDPTSHPFNIKCGQAPFQVASLSESQPNPESLDDSHIIYILGYQAIAGLSYFRITIYNPDYSHPGPRARMDVDLVGCTRSANPRRELGGRLDCRSVRRGSAVSG